MLSDVIAAERLIIRALSKDWSVRDGMDRILKMSVRKRSKYGRWDQVSGLPFEDDAVHLEHWITAILAIERPRSSVRLYKFNVCLTIDSSRDGVPRGTGSIESDLEIFGFAKYDPEDRNIPIAYCPKDSRAKSYVLRKLEEICGDMGENPDRFVFVSVALGYSALAILSACKEIPGKLWSHGVRKRVYVQWGDGPCLRLGAFVNHRFVRRVISCPDGPESE